jgi:hypothetical protein
MTPYAHRRFKGPVGSPLIVPILTLESSASRSRPHRIGRFRRRAILRRFVPHPAKWQMCGGSCSQKPRTRVRTGGAVSPRLRRGPPPGLRFPQTRRSVRPFQAPRTRLRLEAAFGGLVLAGRKGRASHRHRSGLKIPARPLSAPATPAVGGARPLLHWPASPSEERAGLPALGRYAAFGLSIDSTVTATRIECHLCFHAQLLMDPTLSRMNLMRIPAQAPLHALRNTKPERGVQSVRFEAHTR